MRQILLIASIAIASLLAGALYGSMSAQEKENVDVADRPGGQVPVAADVMKAYALAAATGPVEIDRSSCQNYDDERGPAIGCLFVRDATSSEKNIVVIVRDGKARVETK